MAGESEVMQPPWDTFRGLICKGSYALGSACGDCERCTWERTQAIGEQVLSGRIRPGWQVRVIAGRRYFKSAFGGITEHVTATITKVHREIFQ